MYQIDKLARLLSFLSLCNCIYIYTFIREKNRQRPPRSDERKRLYIYIYIHIFIYKRESLRGGMNIGELRLVPTLSILSNIYIWEFLENTSFSQIYIFERMERGVGFAKLLPSPPLRRFNLRGEASIKDRSFSQPLKLKRGHPH